MSGSLFQTRQEHGKKSSFVRISIQDCVFISVYLCTDLSKELSFCFNLDQITYAEFVSWCTEVRLYNSLLFFNIFLKIH